MIWTCLYCKAEIETNADVNNKRLCAECGAAMAPHSVLVKMENGELIQDFGNRRMWLFYCNCPNTVTCQSHDQYRPSCESLTFSPRCLTAMFAELGYMSRRVDSLALAGNSIPAVPDK